MKRKTQRCQATKMQMNPMKVRKCMRPRGHDGRHVDEAGAWEMEDE